MNTSGFVSRRSPDVGVPTNKIRGVNSRNFVVLSNHGKITRCVVMTKEHAIRQRFSTYEMNQAGAVKFRDLRAWRTNRRRPATRADLTAFHVWNVLDPWPSPWKGACCYAFYCKATHQVKFGRTKQLFRRWAVLETQGGYLLQLLAVWHTPKPADGEHQLHDFFAEHRTRGEWFTADPVIEWLQDVARWRPSDGIRAP